MPTGSGVTPLRFASYSGPRIDGILPVLRGSRRLMPGILGRAGQARPARRAEQSADAITYRVNRESEITHLSVMPALAGTHDTSHRHRTSTWVLAAQDDVVRRSDEIQLLGNSQQERPNHMQDDSDRN